MIIRTHFQYLHCATLEACAQIVSFVCAHKSRRLALDLSIEATLSKTHPPPLLTCWTHAS